ncbi:guanylate kinase [Patescibacteria group bacterium]
MNSKVFIISGPSGAGEDSVLSGLNNKISLERPITTTTRKMRDGEFQGSPYYFISKEVFENRIANGDFFEWAEQDAGNLYGLNVEEIERARNTENPVMMKLDYQGVITFKKLIPDSIAILISAPNEVIEKRLRNRDTCVTDEFIQGRLEHAKGWAENKKYFDYEIENLDGKLNETIEKALNIIESNL